MEQVNVKYKDTWVNPHTHVPIHQALSSIYNMYEK